jgi:hypothetical protein
MLAGPLGPRTLRNLRRHGGDRPAEAPARPSSDRQGGLGVVPPSPPSGGRTSLTEPL